MNNYFRITGYCESEDFCFILACHGCYEKLWQFSSFLVQKGLKVLEVSSADKFLDGNIPAHPRTPKNYYSAPTPKASPNTLRKQ